MNICMHVLRAARNDVRAMRAASALAEAGYNVTIIDVDTPPPQLQGDHKGRPYYGCRNVVGAAPGQAVGAGQGRHKTCPYYVTTSIVGAGLVPALGMPLPPALGWGEGGLPGGQEQNIHLQHVKVPRSFSAARFEHWAVAKA